MYSDTPYARAVGHVEDAARVSASDRVMEGHDVPPEAGAYSRSLFSST